jgi:uncharacterized protein YktA (UPF0223 family)
MVVNIAQHVYALYENKIKKFACKWKKKRLFKEITISKTTAVQLKFMIWSSFIIKLSM